MGLDGGKHSGGHSRYDRRDYYQSDYSDYSASSTRSETGRRTHASVRFAEEPAEAQPAAMLGLENKLSDVQKDFARLMQAISEKDTEKFDLIFAILTDLQSGQEQLEESIRDIRKHVGGVQSMGNMGGTPFQYGQMEGMGGQPQQPVQQIVVQPNGGQAMFVPMPQMMVVQSPTGGMMMPQMQPMQQQIVLVGQSPVGQEMGAAFGGCEVATSEQCVDGGEGKMPMLPDLGKHEGSDVDSTDTPTTGISE